MNSGPFGGIAPNLIPNPPGEVPEAPEAGDATPPSPFVEAQDVDQIIAQLTLDRPLKLYIPKELKHPNYEYRVINNIPSEIADAHNKGWRRVDNPEVSKLFDDLIAGTDKENKPYRPLLVARPKAVGDNVRKQGRQRLASLYAGMDPKNKNFENDSKYAQNVGSKDGTFGKFAGDGWRIRV